MLIFILMLGIIFSFGATAQLLKEFLFFKNVRSETAMNIPAQKTCQDIAKFLKLGKILQEIARFYKKIFLTRSCQVLRKILLSS
jgi:hypothetical protein